MSRSLALHRPDRAPARRPVLGRLRLAATGLPADCAAHFHLRSADGSVVVEGDVECDRETRVPAVPAGEYGLRWLPANAVIDGRLHTFVPTVLERRVVVAPDGDGADGSATYVCVRRAG